MAETLHICSLVQDEIRELIQKRDFNALRDVFEDWQPVDIAPLLHDLPDQDEAVIFRILPRKLAAETFDFLDVPDQKALLEALGQEEVAGILNGMSPDDRTALLEELPSEATKQLLTLLSPEKRAVAKSLLGYPENSPGRLMTPNCVAVRLEWTVQQALDYIRAHGEDRDTLNMIYIVNAEGLLLDDLRIRKLLLAPPATTIQDLSDGNYVSLYAGDSRDKAVALFRDTDRVALPITDSQSKLLGIVTVDDVLDVAEERATRDIQMVGGSEALDEPYDRIPFWRMIRKRGSWLVILFLGEMLTATAMGYFEKEIAQAVVLALFVPLIISSGGNSGSQAATLVIRALALGEISLGDWWRVVRREVMAGLALGAILGFIGFLRISVWSMFSNLYGPHWFLVAATVALSLVGVVMWGTLSGAAMPLILRRLGADPAASSAPFVATLVDVTGLVIYFTVAHFILSGSLL